MIYQAQITDNGVMVAHPQGGDFGNKSAEYRRQYADVSMCDGAVIEA